MKTRQIRLWTKTPTVCSTGTLAYHIRKWSLSWGDTVTQARVPICNHLCYHSGTILSNYRIKFLRPSAQGMHNRIPVICLWHPPSKIPYLDYSCHSRQTEKCLSLHTAKFPFVNCHQQGNWFYYELQHYMTIMPVCSQKPQYHSQTQLNIAIGAISKMYIIVIPQYAGECGTIKCTRFTWFIH